MYLKLDTYCIWTEKKSCGTKNIIKIKNIKHQQNNNRLRVFNLIKPNHLKLNQTEIEKIVWIWYYPINRMNVIFFLNNIWIWFSILSNKQKKQINVYIVVYLYINFIIVCI